MANDVLTVPLGGSVPGTSRWLKVFRFGTAGARPRAYIQAGLHADEIPGMLIAHHLIRRLRRAAADGLMRGEVQVVPVANPIGLAQTIDEKPMGRFDMGGGGNFNRHYPDLSHAAAEHLRDRLCDDPEANVALIRAALTEALHDRRACTETDHLRLALLRQAITADIVLDLHCDEEAPAHLYVGTPLWPAAEDLARDMGAEAVLLADVSGGEPFDEACSSPWWRLRTLLGDDRPIPTACLSGTLEYRGMSDVSDALAAADADNLFRFLQRRGLVAGDPGPLPPPRCGPTPLEGLDMVTTPVPGLIAYRVAVGDRVAAGDVVAEIVDPVADDPGTARRAVATATAGRVLTLMTHRMARPGDVIAKVVGAEPLPDRGPYLLTAC
jgi:hypothetical protein